VSAEELKVRCLSPKGLSLVSEFALFLYRLNGTVINVDAKDVLLQIDFHARKSTDPQLRKVYMNLRQEVRRESPKLESSRNAKILQLLLSKRGEHEGKQLVGNQ